MISVIALSEILGASIRDAEGRFVGRLDDLALAPEEHPTRIGYVVARVGREHRLIPARALFSTTGGQVRLVAGPTDWPPATSTEGVLLLKRDLLDQQIIDVHGRKVVRVNDVELDADPEDGHVTLTLLAVDVGARGAVRRLAKGIVPRHTLRGLLDRIPPRVIPWAFVDLIETDPSRRVKLKIAYEGLSSLHPADIADIVEDLPPAEREAVFETIDEGVAADTLEELDPKVQVAIVESLDSDRAADIVEQMDPDAAADLLGDLPETDSGAILREMEPAERHGVRQLLEFGERTAAGRMTTEFLAVHPTATVEAGIVALRGFEGGSRRCRRSTWSSTTASWLESSPWRRPSWPAARRSCVTCPTTRSAAWPTRPRTRSPSSSTSTTSSRFPWWTTTAAWSASSRPTT